jgi:hypothetical protein
MPKLGTVRGKRLHHEPTGITVVVVDDADPDMVFLEVQIPHRVLRAFPNTSVANMAAKRLYRMLRKALEDACTRPLYYYGARSRAARRRHKLRQYQNKSTRVQQCAKPAHD